MEMGLFQWLGRLLDQLIGWLGQAVAAFLEALVWSIQRIWETTITALLIASFGRTTMLYVIFYAGYVLGETVMEIWDPYDNSKPSEVLKFRRAPQDSPLPTNRGNARVLELQS